MSYRRFLVSEVPKKGTRIELSKGENKHATQVLRVRTGDLAEAIDGRGHGCTCKCILEGKKVFLAHHFDWKVPEYEARRKVLPISLELAILKGSAMEWAIEKVTELGVKTVTPVITERTVVQIKNKGVDFFQERWQKISDQSLKQCGRLFKMEVEQPISLEILLKERASRRRAWLNESAYLNQAPSLLDWVSKANAQPFSLLVGPEGGWSESEANVLRKTSATAVHVGPLVLRAETAAIVASSIAQTILTKTV